MKLILTLKKDIIIMKKILMEYTITYIKYLRKEIESII